MTLRNRSMTAVAAVAGAAALAGGAMLAADGQAAPSRENAAAARVVQLRLTPSSSQLAACMRGARVNVSVRLTAETAGFDTLRITARNLPPNRPFTVFLLQQAETPFGAAEYIGDFESDAYGRGAVTLKLIVEEAFSSTLVGGNRVRVDLNRMGAWFADPRDDDFCLGAGSPVTPFDGDNEAGVQAFNSRNSPPLP